MKLAVKTSLQSHIWAWRHQERWWPGSLHPHGPWASLPGCGLRVEEPFVPSTAGERLKLFAAASSSSMFVLHDVSAQASSDEEQALRLALAPLTANEDCHFVAAVMSLVQSLLEGRCDCPISAVFGAGKTLCAAAMIAGLLVMDPTLKIMIVTFCAWDCRTLSTPWLGGLLDVELQKGPANKTDLDVLQPFVMMSCDKQVSLGPADPGFVSLSEGDPESSDQEMFEELGNVRIIKRHPVYARICHQDWVHHFGTNIPFLCLVPHLPGRRSILNFQWIEHCWISVDRMLLQPLLIALADGFHHRRAPTSREPNIQGVHQAHRSKPWEKWLIDPNHSYSW